MNPRDTPGEREASRHDGGAEPSGAPLTSSEIPDPHAACPACGRFMGPATVCPYCDAVASDAPWKRTIRCGSLVLAVAGLGFLYGMARLHTLPLTPIGDLAITHQYAVVRIAGRVQRDAYISRGDTAAAYASFYVNDASGHIRVSARGKTAQRLVAEDRLPKGGDQVEVTGVVSVSADGVLGIRLQDVRQLRVFGSAPPSRPSPRRPTAPAGHSPATEKGRVQAPAESRGEFHD